MSRAFVKEADGDAAVEDLPDLPVSPHPNIVTARGLELIDAKISELQDKLNTQLKPDRSALAHLTRDLRYWAARRATAELAPPQDDISEVRFGHKVTIDRNGKRETFRIVGQDEADPAQGLLSYVSPLAQALMGNMVGDVIAFGPAEVEIIDIRI